jgi:hypothetical protein
MVLTTYHWLHPVDLGHLSGAIDDTCQRERNPIDILRIIPIRRPRKMSIIATCATYSDHEVYRTLAESTHLARKVCTFNSRFDDPDLATALRNMTSLRILTLSITLYSDIFEGYTFKIDSFTWSYPNNKYLRKFLSSQPSLKNVVFDTDPGFQLLEAMCLPGLPTRFPGSSTSFMADPLARSLWLEIFSHERSIDLSFFTLGTPQSRSMIDYYYHPDISLHQYFLRLHILRRQPPVWARFRKIGRYVELSL